MRHSRWSRDSEATLETPISVGVHSMIINYHQHPHVGHDCTQKGASPRTTLPRSPRVDHSSFWDFSLFYICKPSGQHLEVGWRNTTAAALAQWTDYIFYHQMLISVRFLHGKRYCKPGSILLNDQIKEQVTGNTFSHWMRTIIVV
jgi:hypothetical protein